MTTLDKPSVHPAEARQRYRNGLVAPTSGVAPGFTQANVVVLPREWAFDMLLFGQRNPRPVPLLDVTDPGSFRTALATGADLRTDLPRYRVLRRGELVDEPADVRGHWRDDLVAFLLGCSFTFERALSGGARRPRADWRPGGYRHPGYHAAGVGRRAGV